MKNVLKSIITLAVLVCIILSVAGCGSIGGTVSTISIVKKPVIRVANQLSGDQLTEFKSLLAKLSAKSSNYSLEYVDVSAQNYYSEIQSELKAGTAPDIIMYPVSMMPDMAKGGYFADITDKAQKDGKLKLRNYYQSALDSVKIGEKIYGLPAGGTPEVLYYNKDIFDKSHIAYPDSSWSWNDLRTAAKALTADTNGDGKTDQWGLDYNFSYMGCYLIIPSYGSDLKSVKTNEFRNSITMYADIIKDKSYVTMEEIQSSQTSFNTGKVAMTINIVNQTPTYAFKFGISEIPHDKVKGTIIYNYSFAVNAKSKFQDAAYKALVDLTKSYTADMMPPSKDGFSIAFTNKISKYYNIKVIENSLNYVNFEPMFTQENSLLQIISSQIITPITNGSKTVEQAINDTAEKLGE